MHASEVPSPARAATSPTVLVWTLARPFVSLGVSVGLHLALLSPVLLWMVIFAEPRIESPGEEGDVDGPVGNDGGEVPEGVADPEPLAVSIYEEPVEPSPSAIEPTPAVGPGPAPVDAAARPSPVEGTAEGDPNTTTISPATRAGVQGRRPRGSKKPCDPIAEISSISEGKWRVERDVVDYYASHLRELQKQVAVSTHAGADGKPDGVRIFLPRCSVLRQAGIKHGDIVHTVNGRRVATLTDGIAAYLLLRNEDNLVVELSRRSGEGRTHRYRLQR